LKLGERDLPFSPVQDIEIRFEKEKENGI